jgi:hypothetical protein
LSSSSLPIFEKIRNLQEARDPDLANQSELPAAFYTRNQRVAPFCGRGLSGKQRVAPFSGIKGGRELTNWEHASWVWVVDFKIFQKLGMNGINFLEVHVGKGDMNVVLGAYT